MVRRDTDEAHAPTLADSSDGSDGSRPRDSGAAKLLVGHRLGERYQIRSYLGEGGMGAVYRAFDEVLGEEVALKVVRGVAATEAHLRDEVRVAQKVTHRNVCRIYDLIDVEGRHFVKMEYIAGDTLAARIAADGALPIPEAIRIARAVAEGLASAHARQIVHRDLKPSNVMLAGDRVVLMDFGLARAIADAPSDRSGTPSYMAPEQLAGTGLDERSDFFALGCLLYEMLAGKRAFDLKSGTSYTELAAERTAVRSPDLRTVRPQTPRWLTRAVDDLLATDPALRPRGVARLRRGSRRATVVVAAGVAALALTGGVAIFAAREPAPWRPHIVEIMGYAGNADSPAISPDGKTIAVAVDPGNLSHWGIYTFPLAGPHRPHLVTPADRSCVSGRWTRDGSGLLVRCGMGSSLELLRLPLEGGPPTSLGSGSLAEDCGDVLAVVDVDVDTVGQRLLVRTAAGADTMLARAKNIPSVRCSADGNQILFVAQEDQNWGGSVMLADRRANTVREVAKDARNATFGPGEKTILFTQFAGEQSRIAELDLASARVRVLTPDEHDAVGVDVARDGTFAIFHRDLTVLPLYEIGTAGDGRPRTFQQESFRWLAPVPNTDLVVAVRTDQNVHTIVAIDVRDGSLRELVEGYCPFISHDGRRVLFQSAHDPSMLESLALDGQGGTNRVAKLPGPIAMGADGPDGIHVAIDRGEALEGYLVDSNGSSRPDGTNGLQLFAPSGPWRVVETGSPGRLVLQFSAPGKPTFQRIAHGRPVWVDDHTISFCDITACHVMDVETQVDRVTRPDPAKFDREASGTADGKRWFYTPPIAQVSLQKIANLADR